MIAIGVGCRKACPAADIVALVEATMALLPPGVAPGGLFSIIDKQGEPGLAEAARALALPLAFLDRDTLALATDGAESRSERVDDLFGLPSVAETAALAGAGQGAILLVSRKTSTTATCAIAGPPPNTSVAK